MNIYFSVRNCGDDSAYPVFFDSLILAQIDQEYEYELTGEGSGDSCTGFIEVKGNNISCDQMQTAKDWIEDHKITTYDSDRIKSIKKNFIEKVSNLAKS